ncbi:MAG: transporter substrate-binding protein [Ilumatobacteraceae bacterium]|nr:transporter substrate-binding protein [Ilumatobacteraceae bacterium]
MLRIALKNVLGRKGRLLLSALAVIAGCAFLSGVLVFSDTINARIDSLFATAFDKTDAYVRSSVVIKNDFGDDLRGQISEDLVKQVAAVPGVKSADADVRGIAIVTDKDGKVLGGGGPPQFGGVFANEPSAPWKLKEGRAAANGNEVVLDTHTAKLGKLAIGDKVTVSVTNQPRQFTVVGIVRFGNSDSTGGPTWALFDLKTAEEFVLDKPGEISSINVIGDGTRSQTELKAAIQQLFPKDQVEVLTGKEIIKESQDSLAQQFSFFTLFLTVFAGISIFVGCFVIYNVFKISAAQRLRENALLRAIGARSSQVTMALFVEAVVVGILGAVLGFAGGVALAFIITSALNASGNGPGNTSLTISPSAFIITFIVGLVVTVVCATFPAIRAGRVPPLAAMRDVSIDRSGASRKRIVTSIVSAGIAVLGIALGLATAPIWLAPGVIGLFVAVIALGPFVVGRIAEIMTGPLGKLRGVTGEVAGRNAARSPERTALTAAALGIGLALLVSVSTLASSLQDSLRTTFAKAFNGQIAVAPENSQGGLLPVSLADDLNKLPEVGAAVGFGGGSFKIIGGGTNGKDKDSVGITVDPATVAQLFNLHFAAGDWSVVKGDDILVSQERANDDHLKVGDTFQVSFLNQSKATFRIGGIFSDKNFGTFFIDRAAFASSGQPMFDFQVAVNPANGVSVGTALAAIKTVVTEKYPSAKVQTQKQFIDDQIAALDGIITFIYALLLMSVFIAVLGIVLTLLLAVYERRRELGLMRAIGTTRAQIRGSIRWESVITAILGALMGIALGLALGWVVVTALKDQGLNTFSIAPASLIAFAIMSILFALAAAWWPARKAAKAPILEAIATT